ncbi:hypothetical protein GQ457_07G024040 [Hibiscus cannabinus]
MAASFDCGVSSLLCAEDNSSIFDDKDDSFGGVGTPLNHRLNGNSNQNRVFGGLALQSEECVALMVEKEHQHLPNADYLKRLQTCDLDPAARQEAVDFIRKVHAHFGFGPLCEYLSVNYLDRFLSAYELPKGKAWTMQLLAVACVSLGAKMEEIEVPLLLDLQVGECKFVFEARTIQRMELLVLSTLRWRMQAITPFSFIDNFLYKLNGDKTPPRSSILRSIQLISSTVTGIELLEFKPSEIAAAVAISVAVETTTVDAEKAVSFLTPHVQKERVMKCVELMSLVPCVPQSPIGVLEAARLSYRSEDSSSGTKRRKLNGPCEMEL